MMCMRGYRRLLQGDLGEGWKRSVGFETMLGRLIVFGWAKNDEGHPLGVTR